MKNILFRSYSAPRDLSSVSILYYEGHFWTTGSRLLSEALLLRAISQESQILLALATQNSFINFNRTICAKQTGLASAKNYMPCP